MISVFTGPRSIYRDWYWKSKRWPCRLPKQENTQNTETFLITINNVTYSFKFLFFQISNQFIKRRTCYVLTMTSCIWRIGNSTKLVPNFTITLHSKDSQYLLQCTFPPKKSILQKNKKSFFLDILVKFCKRTPYTMLLHFNKDIGIQTNK